MKNLAQKLYTAVAAYPGGVGAVAVLAAAIASRFGFYVTSYELIGTATAVAGAFAHKVHANAKAAVTTDATLNAGAQS